MTKVQQVFKISKETADLAFERAEEVLRMARALLVRHNSPYPYFAPLASLFRFVRVVGCPSVAVDKWGRIYFNPFFVLSFHHEFPKTPSDESLRSFLSSFDIADYPINVMVEVLRHEVEHLFRRHFLRADLIGVTDDKREKWNIAADLEINQHINCPPLDPLIYKPSRLGLPDGLSAEEYYSMLPENDGDGGGGSGGGTVVEVEGSSYPVMPGRMDDGGSGAGVPRGYELPPNDKDQPGNPEAKIHAQTEETARQMKEYAKTRGTVPADLLRLADEILNPKINWRKLLAHLLRKVKTLTAMGKEDYSWAKPNRRSDAYKPFIMPALTKPEGGSVAVVIDTSGSMSERELERAVSETIGIARQANVNVDAYICDAAVHRVVRGVKNFGQLRELVGGGGTDMVEGIRKALEARKYDAIVVMTDGHSPFPEHPTPVPLIICLIGESHAPVENMPKWAKVVVVED